MININSYVFIDRTSGKFLKMFSEEYLEFNKGDNIELGQLIKGARMWFDDYYKVKKVNKIKVYSGETSNKELIPTVTNCKLSYNFTIYIKPLLKAKR